MENYQSKCGRVVGSKNKVNGHVSRCQECKEIIEKEKLEWNKQCECGCGKTTRYGCSYASKRCYYNIGKSEDIKKKIKDTLNLIQQSQTKEEKELHSQRTKEGMKKSLVDLRNRRKGTPNRELLSQRAKEKWKNSEIREKMLAGIKESITPERKKEMSETSKEKWCNLEYKERVLRKWRVNAHTPEINERTSIRTKKFWSNPENKKRTGEKISKTKAERIASGDLIIKHGKEEKGYYKEEFYGSSYELERMKYYDKNHINWTKKHKIIISYKDLQGKDHYYIPDFKIIEDGKIIIEEIKGYIKENDKEKAFAAILYCKEKSVEYRFLLGKDFQLIKELSFLL